MHRKEAEGQTHVSGIMQIVICAQNSLILQFVFLNDNGDPGNEIAQIADGKVARVALSLEFVT